MLVIAPGNDSVIAAMLRPSTGLRWRLEQFRVHQRWIDARYRARDGGWAILRLLAREHPAPPSSYSSRVSERFRVVVLQRSANAEVPVLLDAVYEQVRTHEPRFRWLREPSEPQVAAVVEPRDLDVEELIFEAGIKPALRLRFEPNEAPLEVGRWLRRGAAVVVLDFDTTKRHPYTYLLVAHTRDRAMALADAELRQYLPAPAWHQAVRDCGELLGYPRCCVEAFLRETIDESGEEDGELEARRSNFRRADAAWVPHPRAELNTVVFRARLGLISFDPCRFDCAAALAYAERVAALVEARCPGYCAELRGVFAIDHDDLRAELELDDRRSVRAATALDDESRSFADQLVGRQVDANGRVPGLPCRVFEFEAPSPG